MAETIETTLSNQDKQKKILSLKMLDEVEKLDREPSCKLVMNSSSAYFCISV
jgi:hypothetical protein